LASKDELCSAGKATVLAEEVGMVVEETEDEVASHFDGSDLF
jgi:hypothetical protein